MTFTYHGCPRISSYTLGGTSYDISGNLLNDTFHTYTWDAYGDMASIDGNAITYDALSREVEKSNPTQQILYGPLGKMGIMNGQTWVFASIPLPGGSTMLKGQVPGIVYAWVRHGNHLGSVTVESTLNGRAVNSDKAFAPFGEQYNTGAAGNGDTVWAGISPDTVAGTYDALYRKYNPNQGRWVSPDPSGLNAVDPSNPQTWNRYAYVLNNPLSNIDPTGLECVWDDGSFDSADDPVTGSKGGCAGQGGTWVDPDLFENAMLTNGQWNSNYGDWSSSASPYLAQNWATASATANAQPGTLLQLLTTTVPYYDPTDVPLSPSAQAAVLAIHNAVANIPNPCAIGVQVSVGNASATASLSDSGAQGQVSYGQLSLGQVESQTMGTPLIPAPPSWLPDSAQNLLTSPVNAQMQGSGVLSVNASKSVKKATVQGWLNFACN